MSARRDYTDSLRDILEYADKAERFVAGIDFPAFQSNEEKALAVIRALEVIGEAARHIPAPLRAQYSDVPWEDMVGMRSKLIHDYFGVDLKVAYLEGRYSPIAHCCGADACRHLKQVVLICINSHTFCAHDVL